MPDLETRDINGVEIFATGTHNGDMFAEKDLDTIVDSFNKTKEFMKPFLKFGHNKEQRIAKSDGMPALGWIESLKRKGTKIVADFKRIPKKVHDLIASGAFRRISIEMFTEKLIDGKTFKNVLSAVALLGADIPAVKTLDDIINLFAQQEGVKVFDEEEECKTYSLDINTKTKKEDINMSEEIIKELRQQKTDQEKGFKEKEKTFEETIEKKDEEIADKDKKIEEQGKEIEKKDGEIKEAEKEKKLSEINAKVDKFIEEKHLVPADKEKTAKMLLKLHGDEDATKTYIETIERADINVHTDEEGNLISKTNKKPDPDYEDEEKHDKIKQYMEKHEVTYGVAFDAISLEDNKQ